MQILYSCFFSVVFLLILGTNLYAETQTKLGLNYMQYVSANENYFRDGAISSSQSMQLEFNSRWAKNNILALAHVKDDFQAQEEFHYVKPMELAVGAEFDSFQIYLGRKSSTWSLMDETWNLGLWQPRFMDDKMVRESAGLLGLFFHAQTNQWEYTLMVSPFFLPEMGPHFNLSEGRLTSKNPWFHTPSSEIMLGGQDESPTPLVYTMAPLDYQDIVQHGSVAGSVWWTPEKASFLKLGVSGALKPMNQILLGFPVYFQVRDPKSGPNYVEANLHTRVLYHKLLSFEAEVQPLPALRAWASWTVDQPIRDSINEKWITQEVGPASVGSLYMSYNLRGEGSYATQVYASYLKVQGGDQSPGGKFTLSAACFERRWIFQEAFQLGLQHSAPWLTSKNLTMMRASLIFDSEQHGVVFRSELQQKIQKEWLVSLHADLIGLTDRNGRIQDGFTSLYRTNDRVGLGVQYLF